MKKIVMAGSVRKVGKMLWELRYTKGGKLKIKLVKSQTAPSLVGALGNTGGR